MKESVKKCLFTFSMDDLSNVTHAQYKKHFFSYFYHDELCTQLKREAQLSAA